jgi:hypothetical protein
MAVVLKSLAERVSVFHFTSIKTEITCTVVDGVLFLSALTKSMVVFKENIDVVPFMIVSDQVLFSDHLPDFFVIERLSAVLRRHVCSL